MNSRNKVPRRLAISAAAAILILTALTALTPSAHGEPLPAPGYGHHGGYGKCKTTYKTVYDTIYDTVYKEKCSTSYKKKCKTVYETKYKTKYKKHCDVKYVPKCHTSYDTIYEKKCKVSYKHKVSRN